jgi:hypothetical protein
MQEFNTQQRELLLEGLRYLRSSRRLAFREPLAPPNEQREGDLRIISDLMLQLSDSNESTVSVK